MSTRAFYQELAKVTLPRPNPLLPVMVTEKDVDDLAVVFEAVANGAAAVAFGLMGMALAIGSRGFFTMALCDACAPRFALVRDGVIERGNCDACGVNGGVRADLPLGGFYWGTYEYRCRYTSERRSKTDD